MFGLFQNNSRLISGSLFKKHNQNTIIKSCLHQFGAPQVLGRSNNIFALSQISIQNTKQLLKYQQMLDSTNQESNPEFHEELVQRINESEQIVQETLDKIKLYLDSQITNIPITGLANYTYTLSYAEESSEKATQVFNKHIKNLLLEKIQYASQQDLANLVEGLVKLKVQDKQVWDKVLETIEGKTFDWQLNEIDYYGWELNSYQVQQNKCTKTFPDSFDVYYNAVQDGQSNSVAHWKRQLVKSINDVYVRIVSPFFFRESIPLTVYNEQPEEQAKEKFLQNLAQASESVSRAKQTLEHLQNKATVSL